MSPLERFAKRILEGTGVAIDGPNPWDIRVNDPRFYRAIFFRQALGAGESYMKGWWDCDQLDEAVFRLIRSGADRGLRHRWLRPLSYLANLILNRQHSRKELQHPYEDRTDLLDCMLGETKAYSGAYWRDAETLDQAQRNKFDLICRKLELGPQHHVLDIGCGYGGFARFAAERYGCRVTGVNTSLEQVAYAKRWCESLPVEVIHGDFRDPDVYNPDDIRYDRVVSVGQFEHVGPKNYRAYFELVRKQLQDDGLFLLQTVGKNESTNSFDPWFDKYVLPDIILPSLQHLTRAMEGILVIEDLHNFGADYDKTARAFHRNCEANWSKLGKKYDETFRRMWTYYLLAGAGTFRARDMQLWQIVTSKQGLVDGYRSVR
jgi:cyclopropane-fatty-acyl-phospholipid synthase